MDFNSLENIPKIATDLEELEVPENNGLVHWNGTEYTYLEDVTPFL